MSRRASGFTLIEVLVALAIFSLAALALIRLDGAALGTAARLDERAIAAIVARNQGNAALLEPVPPTFGASAGIESNAGRAWPWTRTVSRTPDRRLQRIDIRVAGSDGSTLASFTVLRRTS